MKKFRRKTWAFYFVFFGVCAPAGIIHGVNWPLVVLTLGIYLVYTAAISAEKVLLRYIDSMKK